MDEETHNPEPLNPATKISANAPAAPNPAELAYLEARRALSAASNELDLLIAQATKATARKNEAKKLLDAAEEEMNKSHAEGA